MAKADTLKQQNGLAGDEGLSTQRPCRGLRAVRPEKCTLLRICARTLGFCSEVYLAAR